MADVRHLFSRYMSTKSAPVGPGETMKVTVSRVAFDTLKKSDGSERECVVVYFAESPLGLVLNASNFEVISGLFGTDTDDWIGKELKLMHDPNVRFGSQKVGGLRLLPAE